ncbi:PLDc N-terminal domain-containing protein [Paraliobacillus sp. JSM ZJ581]|uniref:PLDc N-terminal domain-containing protein n=1 Tax=Paraliobacillus sp. JSM ZJ581 TaxID=3342118 RepID=UPI0035A98E72
MDIFLLLAPLIVLEAILVIVALLAWFKTDKTNGPRWLWLFIILLLQIIGPILFFIIGRRQQ